jgi:hypothetical protein
MLTATSFWGDDNTNCPDAAIANGTPGTCNGNGDGVMNDPAGASQSGEIFRFWQQLALAGLVEGTYSGLAGSGGATHGVSGTNIMPSKAPGVAWAINYSSPAFAGSSASYQMFFGNNFFVGAPTSTTHASGTIFKPEEVWNIDTKTDDGMPATGRLILTYWTQCSTSASKTDFAGAYRLDNTNPQCAIRFVRLF